MAQSDSELISEVRALTDYDDRILSNSDVQTLVNIGKKEIRAEYGDPETFPGFYSGNLSLDRALFWFTCIACKIKTGEIGGIELSISDLDAQSGEGTGFETWFRNFSKRLRAYEAAEMGMASTNASRDNRSYGFDQPDL
jgi:hypothetical protein